MQVLNLLGGGQNGLVNRVKRSPQPSVVPDLIDTSGPDDLLAAEDSKQTGEPMHTNTVASGAPLIDDLFGDSINVSESTKVQQLDDDPFADVSFHSNQNKDNTTDFFSVMPVQKSGDAAGDIAAPKTASVPFDLFGSSSEVSHEFDSKKDVSDLMGGLSVNGNDPFAKHNESATGKASESGGSASTIYPDNNIANILNSGFASQGAGINANPMPPMGATTYNFPPGLMFNPAFASQQMNYGAMVAQQQFLATMANFQQLGNLQSDASINASGPTGGNVSPLPDIFTPGMATQPPTSLMNDSRREDTKAFDFISVSSLAHLHFYL